jgi:hypothetical protein
MKAKANRHIAQTAISNRLETKSPPDKPALNEIDPKSITYQTVTAREASIVVTISRPFEKELTSTPVKKPETQKASASST